MQGLNKQPLTTEEALALPGLHDQAVGYAVLHLMNIFSPIRDLISELSHKNSNNSANIIKLFASPT
jgi:hypothetical protein